MNVIRSFLGQEVVQVTQELPGCLLEDVAEGRDDYFVGPAQTRRPLDGFYPLASLPSPNPEYLDN
jgi:hypothetical protein